MKKHIFILLFLGTLSSYSQIAKYNHFPTMKPHHILDDNLTNISFAFSMRVLESDYDGPLIRLRRSGDNAEMDFGWGDNDIVDVAAINAWRGTRNVFVRTWYDQSGLGLGRNAVQTVRNRQPRFFPDPNNPYFQGDGVNDHLTVDNGSIQDVTNNGEEGTVLSVMRATKRSQHTFGVLRGSNRWSAHVNWSNGDLYFDPGFCCNSSRSFNNNANAGSWQVYTYINGATTVSVRAGGVVGFSGNHTTNPCTLTDDFAIGWATGNEPNAHATTGFTEFIMYSMDKTLVEVSEIEQNAITFWNL